MMAMVNTMEYPVGYYSYQNPNYVYHQQIQAVPTNGDLDISFEHQHHHQQQQHPNIYYKPQMNHPHHQQHQQQQQQIQQIQIQQMNLNRKRQLESPPPQQQQIQSNQQQFIQHIYSPIGQNYTQKTNSSPYIQHSSPSQMHHTPLHTSPNSLSFAYSVPGSQPTSPPSDLLDEDIDDQLREYLAPLFAKSLDQSAREHLMSLIADYFNEEMPLAVLFNELRGIALEDHSLLHYLIEIFIVMDTTNKMYTYLAENGINEQELNIDTKNFAMLFDADGGFKKRERSRKSVSRGLRNPPNKWTKEESQRLIQLVHESGDKQWKKIALQIGGGKTGAQCAQHWKRVLCPAIRKGSWDEEEEAKLFQLVDRHGQSWKNVASEIRTRTDIQCRYQYFKSCMSREIPWSPKEDELLQKKVIECKQEGREISWMDLSKSMARARQTKIPRTALECKSRWESISHGSIVDGLDISNY